MPGSNQKEKLEYIVLKEKLVCILYNHLDTISAGYKFYTKECILGIVQLYLAEGIELN